MEEETLIIKLDKEEYDKFVAAVRPQYRFTRPSISDENLIVPPNGIFQVPEVVFMPKDNK